MEIRQELGSGELGNGERESGEGARAILPAKKEITSTAHVEMDLGRMGSAVGFASYPTNVHYHAGDLLLLAQEYWQLISDATVRCCDLYTAQSRPLPPRRVASSSAV